MLVQPTASGLVQPGLAMNAATTHKTVNLLKMWGLFFCCCYCFVTQSHGSQWGKYVSVLETWSLQVGIIFFSVWLRGAKSLDSPASDLPRMLQFHVHPQYWTVLDYFSHSNFFPGAEAMVLSSYLRCMDYLDNFIFIPEKLHIIWEIFHVVHYMGVMSPLRFTCGF